MKNRMGFLDAVYYWMCIHMDYSSLTMDERKQAADEVMHYIGMGAGTFTVSKKEVAFEFVGFPEDEDAFENMDNATASVKKHGMTMTFTFKP